MKQRLASAAMRKPSTPIEEDASWTLWRSPVGWTGLLGSTAGLRRVLMGYATRSDLEQAIGDTTSSLAMRRGQTPLCDRLDAYFSGERDSFDDVAVAPLWSTPFQKSVVQALRQVPYGQTTSYADLALRAGRPGAARAVGQVMATNPVPIVVPCHRVLASGGKLGGFSAPTGIVLKQWLLELESQGCHPCKPR